jgi:hypothetical protein
LYIRPYDLFRNPDLRRVAGVQERKRKIVTGRAEFISLERLRASRKP